jgi:TRAP transporter TAXI family solute receptor
MSLGACRGVGGRAWPMVVGLLAVLAVAAPAGAAPYRLAIATGGVTGIYYQFGAAICRLLRDHPPAQPITCVTEGSGGAVANLQNLRAGEVPLALTQSDTIHDAATGTGVFARQGPDPKLRALFSPLTEAFMVLTRDPDWAPSLADLRGLRVNIGPPTSGSEATFRDLLAARGWSASEFTRLTGLRTSLQAAALCSGQVDAISFVAANPVPVMQEATFACRSRFVPLDQEFAGALIARYPYYVSAEVPGGLYPNNPDPVPTIGVRAIVAASSDTPDDVVYAITRTVFENMAQLRTLHLAFARATAEDMLDQCVFAPVHAGAARYYREAGLRMPRRCLP